MRIKGSSHVGQRVSQPPCNPKQQIYKGEPGAILVCPSCQQTMRGIPYPYGIGLLTLPTHYDPYWKKRSLGNFEPDRIFRRRSTSR
jgi:hypothetical protein